LIIIAFGLAEALAFSLRKMAKKRMLKIEMIKIKLREMEKSGEPEPQPEEAELMHV
jgi:uncharacterized OsmC-like protein